MYNDTKSDGKKSHGNDGNVQLTFYFPCTIHAALSFAIQYIRHCTNRSIHRSFMRLWRKHHTITLPCQCTCLHRPFFIPSFLFLFYRSFTRSFGSSFRSFFHWFLTIKSHGNLLFSHSISSLRSRLNLISLFVWNLHAIDRKCQIENAIDGSKESTLKQNTH